MFPNKISRHFHIVHSKDHQTKVLVLLNILWEIFMNTPYMIFLKAQSSSVMVSLVS